MSKCVLSAVAAVAFMLQPASACEIFHLGRIHVGIQGLSDQCCVSVRPSITNVPFKHDLNDVDFNLAKEFSANCCGSEDQNILATALPDKFTQGKGKGKTAMACERARELAAKGKGKGKGNMLSENPILQLFGVDSFVAQRKEINMAEKTKTTKDDEGDKADHHTPSWVGGAFMGALCLVFVGFGVFMCKAVADAGAPKDGASGEYVKEGHLAS